MYALFHRTYDHFCWDDFIVASDSVTKLKQHYKKLLFVMHPLINENEYEYYSSGKMHHYIILKIEVI